MYPKGLQDSYARGITYCRDVCSVVDYTRHQHRQRDGAWQDRVHKRQSESPRR